MLKKTTTMFYREIDGQIIDVDENALKIANKYDLNTLFEEAINKHSNLVNDKRFTIYKFNQREFDDNYKTNNNNNPFLIEIDNGPNKFGKLSHSKLTKKSTIKKYIDENIFEIIEEEEEIEDSKNNTDNIIKENIDNEEIKEDNKENFLIFGKEIIPLDNEPIGKPPIKIIEVSDIELEEEEEIEIEELDNPMFSNKNQIIDESNSENHYQFTEHILNQVKSPIDMISIGEKVFELCDKNFISKKKINLSSLNIFRIKNNINIQLFKYLNMTGQYNQFLQNGKFSINDYLSNEQKEEVPTAMAIDNYNYKINNFIWFGTNKGNLLRIPICSKPSQENQSIVVDSEETGISSLDVFENSLITGHFDGTIQLLENQNILEKIKDIKKEIIQIKFIKANSKKKKYEFIFSDLGGNVNYIKIYKSLFSKNKIKQSITENKDFPVYKICLFSLEPNKIKKKNTIIALASLNNVTLYKIRPKNENQRIALIEIPYGKLGEFFFDCDFGYGFPPIPELYPSKEKENKKNFSLIENTLIEKGMKETILFVVSFGLIIKLFKINFDKKYSIKFTEIGHFIEDSPICRLGFISKSFLTLINNNKYIKIINTFSFKNEIYNNINSVTQNKIISYDKVDLKGLDIIKKPIILFEGKSPDDIHFLNYSLIFNHNIFIVTKQKFLLYKLYRWDEIIRNLCQDEKFKEMIWLSTFLLYKNRNLLLIDSNENNDEEFENALQESLYIFLIKGISKNNNYNELRMFIEFCLKTGRYNDFYKAKDTLSQKQLDNYLYEYTAEYIFNGDFFNFEFEIDFLKDFIQHFVNKHEIILLSKILLKLSVNNLNRPEILKILEEKEIINPFIYAKMKERDAPKIDYFKPIEYLYKIFEKRMKNEKENEIKDDKIKQEYFKLMTKHDMKYYYDKTVTCNDYIGHKLLWYINKCLQNEEYPKDNNLPKNEFEETCKKILLFLTLDNVMELLLKFDSFSYFIILTKLFTIPKLYRIMEIDLDKDKFPYIGLESFFKEYLNDISSEYLSEKYFYYQLKMFVDEKTDDLKNNIYIKYDFYKFTALICDKRGATDLFIDRGTIIDAIKFFINFETFLEGDKIKNYYDPFDCHKIPKKFEVLYKNYSENIKTNILYLLKCLQNNQDFYESDLDDLFLLEGIKNHNKIRTYLSEYGRKYDELFKVKLDEYYKNEFGLTKEENLKQFFEWINDTLNLTKDLDSKSSEKLVKDKNDKKKKTINYFNSFKLFLKSQFEILSKISSKYLYNLLEQWFEKHLQEICFSVNSDELKYNYLNKYFALQSQQEEKDINFEHYLFMKLDLLIKNNHKEQIIKLVERNRILWTEKYLDYLAKNEVLDAAIFISQKRDNIENSIKLTVAQINKTFILIKNFLLRYSDKVNSDLIDIKIEEIKKYLDLGLGACASWTEVNKYSLDDVKNSWLKPLDIFYEFKNILSEANKDNRLGIKYKSNTFNAIYDKVEQFLLENIEYILSKMNDYIPLTFIVEVLCDKFKDSKFKEYSKMFQRMFFSTRRSEEIFKSIFNLRLNIIKNSQKELLDEIKKGLYTDIKICNFCNKEISENENVKNFEYFKCGHLYHISCCPKEKRDFTCYICRMNEFEESAYIDVPNLSFKKKEKPLKNEIIEDNKSNIEEKKKDNRKKRLEKLKKINNKKYNKMEYFKASLENIDNKN